MAELKTVALSSVQLSPENPRLESVPGSNRDALKAMVRAQGERLVELASHIVEHGLNPADLPIVMPHPELEHMYVVLEGNRRVTALKLLENPGLADGEIKGPPAKKLRRLADRFVGSPIESFDALVVASAEEAEPWLRLRHMGQLGGAGLVTWNAADIQRFEARRGKPSIELQILDHLERGKHIPAEVRQNMRAEGITTLRRLISTPEVREQLGIEIDRSARRLSFLYPDREIFKGLKRIVSDIATKKVDSRKLGSSEQRKAYVSSLPRSDRPDPSTVLGAPHERAPAGSEGPTADETSTPAMRRRRVGERTTVAPGKLHLDVSHHRLKRIYGELQGLKPEKHPNASAALLRVFVELSIDHYMDALGLPGKELALHKKATVVATKLKELQILDRNQAAAAIRTITQEFTIGSARSLQAWLHEMSHNPRPKDVILAWDNLQLLLEKIWA